MKVVTRILPELVNQGRELTEIKSQLLLLLDEEQSENLTQKIWSELNPRQGSGEETKAADVGDASEATKATDREDGSDLPNQVSSPGTETFNITSDLEGLQRAFDDQDRERIKDFRDKLRLVAKAVASAVSPAAAEEDGDREATKAKSDKIFLALERVLRRPHIHRSSVYDLFLELYLEREVRKALTSRNDHGLSSEQLRNEAQEFLRHLALHMTKT